MAMCVGTAFGQKANDVAVTLKAQKVLRARDGKEVLQVADRAMPGDEPDEKLAIFREFVNSLDVDLEGGEKGPPSEEQGA